ncbi:MAG: flavodoxin domain-containing protein [Acidimicrobiia bacterium]|nr:flavodoxin domain-containing protein [Acidimicrobiia bacterium]MDH5290441.1 flavodoxin domain-containing protein [Acidimicrobiia bacterium]
MRSVVVYESLYGNTEAVARAVADGLARYGPARHITPAMLGSGQLAGVDLLVVGAPTHARGLPRESTWRPQHGLAAENRTTAPRVRDWLDTIGPGAGRLAVAFDTRVDKPRWITGSAARRVARRLRTQGWRVTGSPRSFLVTGTDGPLVAGELGRARAWGDELGRALASVAA